MSKDTLNEALDSIENGVKSLENELETLVKPVRESAFKRFPIFFTLLVTFGASAVFFGFERLLGDIAILNEHPLVMLSIGIGVLAVTGSLYKKL